MAVIPLVPDTKMADIRKLISLRNLLVRKITWFVLTTTSATLILSRAFGADHMRRIAYIYSRLPRTHSLTFWLTETAFSLSLPPILIYRDSTRTVSLSYILTYRDSTHSHSLTFRLTETAWPCQFVRCNSIRVTWVRIHSATFFFLVLPFRLDVFQPRTQPQKFRQTLKETNNLHGRRHVPPRIHCYISVYWYLAWNT